MEIWRKCIIVSGKNFLTSWARIGKKIVAMATLLVTSVMAAIMIVTMMQMDQGGMSLNTVSSLASNSERPEVWESKKHKRYLYNFLGEKPQSCVIISYGCWMCPYLQRRGCMRRCGWNHVGFSQNPSCFQSGCNVSCLQFLTCCCCCWLCCVFSSLMNGSMSE